MTRGITLPPPQVLNHHASDAVKNGEDVAVHPTNAVQPPAACRDVPANGGGSTSTATRRWGAHARA